MRLPPPRMCGDSTMERSAAFKLGSLFYKPKSRIIRDLGVLALAVVGQQRGSNDDTPLRVLDAMAGSGVRSLRYAKEVDDVGLIHSNELMEGDHPLAANLAPLLVPGGVGRMTQSDAVDLYLACRINDERFDLVDCDAFGTGQPHTAEAWWAVGKGGLLYLCATDSCATAGHNAHKVSSGYAAVAKYAPWCNEQGLRLLLGAAWREAAQRNLHAKPIFSFFHRPSSSMRVMLQLHKAKRPPAHLYEQLAHVGRCVECGETWKVPSTALGDACTKLRTCSCAGSRVDIAGPMWLGPMHDEEFVSAMQSEATRRDWGDTAALLTTLEAEAHAETEAQARAESLAAAEGPIADHKVVQGTRGIARGKRGGAYLFYHLGEVQRNLAARGLSLPPKARLIEMLHEAGHSAAATHIESKALKTDATLDELAACVRAATAAVEVAQDPEAALQAAYEARRAASVQWTEVPMDESLMAEEAAIAENMFESGY